MPNTEANILKKIGDIADDVYFIFNIDDSRFQYIGQSFQKVWNLNIEKVMNEPGLLLNSVHKEDKAYVQECYSKALDSDQETRFEFRIKVKRKPDKYIQLNLYPIQQNNKLLAGIAQDITALRNNINYAEKINARKNSTLIILAHDLKGPIGIVNMMASSIQKELADNKDALQAVKTIQDLCKRNIDLINDLLKNEFLESPQVEIRKERVDIVAAINDIIGNYKRSEVIISKKFILTSSSEKIYILIDNLKLMQAFNNIISNAIKFTHDNGVIKVDIKDKSQSVLVKISDNGIGIPEDLQPYLFEKFTPARRVGLHGEETTGLGMSIIKTIVELHNGKVWFHSEENKGSSFFVEVPKTV